MKKKKIKNDDKINSQNNYFYDSNKHIIKNNAPEDSHFQTIIYLQTMKSYNISIK